MTADEVLIVRGTPESRAMGDRISAAIERCERLNQISYGDTDAVRAAWTELTGQVVDETFHLVPPIRVDHGVNLRVGRNVFINHGCTISDIGGVDIGDDVLIAPNVSLLSSGHPVEPLERTRRVHSGAHRRWSQRLDRSRRDGPAGGHRRRRLGDRGRRRGRTRRTAGNACRWCSGSGDPSTVMAATAGPPSARVG